MICWWCLSKMYEIMFLTFAVAIIAVIIVLVLSHLYDKYFIDEDEMNPYMDSMPFDDELDGAGLATHEVDDYANIRQYKKYKKVKVKEYKYDFEIVDLDGRVVKFNKEDYSLLKYEKTHYLLVLTSGKQFRVSKETASNITKMLLKGIR